MPRPNRPKADLKNGNNLANHPAGSRVVYRPVDVEKHRAFAAGIRGIPPHLR